MRDHRPKNIPRVGERFIKAGFGDVNHRYQTLACIKQDYTQDLLIEKLHVDASSINGVWAIEDPGTRVFALGNRRHRKRSGQRLGLTARQELKQLLKRGAGQCLDRTKVTD